jgi:hypothetical protein
MEEKKLKDSGERRVFETGAQRDRAMGKGLCKFLPPNALMALARHFEYGAIKYSDIECGPLEQNWRKGMKTSDYIDSGLRHSLKLLDGWEDENHIMAAIWNLICLYETRVMIDRGELSKDLDDLPRRGKDCKDYYDL